MDDAPRYWLRATDSKDPWQRATEDEFILAERNAGFRPKSGDGVATAGFSSSRAAQEGSVTYSASPPAR